MKVSDFIRWYIIVHLGMSDYNVDDLGDFDGKVTDALKFLCLDIEINEKIIEKIKLDLKH